MIDQIKLFESTGLFFCYSGCIEGQRLVGMCELDWINSSAEFVHQASQLK